MVSKKKKTAGKSDNSAEKHKTQTIKAIIFDFDDTIADFAKAYRHAMPKFSNKMFVEYGIYGPTTVSVLADVDYKYTHIGRSKSPKYFDRRVWAKDFFETVGIKPKKKDIDFFSEFYWRFAIEGAEALPHAEQVLRALKKKYKLAMMTDSDGNPRIKDERIKATGLGKRFDVIVTSDDSGENKPSRKFYKIILKNLAVKPEECVMVGDKPLVDLELAKKLGMKTVWMQHGRWSEIANRKRLRFKFVDHKIKDLKELLRLF
jgi:putative hydrolase of the HAD superfamily